MVDEYVEPGRSALEPPPTDRPVADLLASVWRDRGSYKAMMVAVVQALIHPSRPVKRLLEQAVTWPNSLPNEPRPPAKCRTARQLCPAEIDELVTGYQAGATVYDLAAQFSIHRATVGEHLRARGIDTTPPGLHPDDIPAAADLYRSGWSLQRIANKYGTTANTVRRRLLEAGVVMREPHDRVC